MVVVLPRAVHAGDQDDERLLCAVDVERFLHGCKQPGDFARQDRFDLAVGNLAVVTPRADRGRKFGRLCRSHIGADQRLFEFAKRRRVQFLSGEDAGDVFAQRTGAFRKPLLELFEKCRWRRRLAERLDHCSNSAVSAFGLADAMRTRSIAPGKALPSK